MSDVAAPQTEAVHFAPVADAVRIFEDLLALLGGALGFEVPESDVTVLVGVTRAIGRVLAKGEMPVYHSAKMRPVAEEGYPEALRSMVRTANEAIARAQETGRSEFFPQITNSTVVEKISDWLVHLRATDPKAYAKVPRMNYAALWQGQERWHADLLKKRSDAVTGDLRSCPVLHRYPDGWAWAWVQTDEQRDAEGDAMGHCVGKGAYDRLGSNAAIVSLRDPAGRPHVTLQIEGIRRIQAQGRGNSRPAEKYNSSIADATGRIGAAVSRYREPRWLDEAEANEILSEEIARSVRKTGHPHRVQIEVPDTELRRIGRAARVARDVVAAHGA